MNKISLESESLISGSSKKYRLAPVLILHIYIPSIQNNPPTYSLLLFLSYKFSSLSSIPESRKLIVKIQENDDVDSDIEMWPLSFQWLLQSALQTPQEGLELRKFKHQTQILCREENIYGEKEYSTNILWNALWQPRGRFPNLNITCDMYENAC